VTTFTSPADLIYKQLEAVDKAIDDPVGISIAGLPETVKRWKEAAILLWEAMSEEDVEKFKQMWPEEAGWVEGYLNTPHSKTL